MQALIFCGGKGTRLQSITHDDIPKPLVDINGKPFIELQIEYLARQGFDHFVLLAGHLHEKIQDHFKDKHYQISYSIESEPLGTGGALKYARDLMDDKFLIVNGDSFLQANYQKLVNTLNSSRAIGVISAFSNIQDSSQIEHNNVALFDDGHVKEYRRGGAGLTHVDAGLCFFSKNILNYFKDSDPKKLSFEEDLWPRLILDKALMACEVPHPPWDIGTPTRLENFKQFIQKNWNSL